MSATRSAGYFRFYRVTLPLREYQKEALSKFLDSKLGVIEMPTGTGKTIVAAKAIEVLKAPTAVFVPTRVLIYQWARVLESFGAPKAGKVMSNMRIITPVTVFTYQYAVRHLEWIESLGFHFFVFDEVHHLGGQVYRKLLRLVKEGVYVMGLTASLERLDGEHRIILSELPLIYRLSLPWAVERGYVAPIELYSHPVDLTPTENEVYESLTKKIGKLFRKLNLRADEEGFREVLRLAQKGDEVARRLISLVQKRKIMLSGVIDKARELVSIMLDEMAIKVLVFTESIEACRFLRKVLLKYRIPAEEYHSKLGEDDRRKALKKWGRTFSVLLSVHALEEGIDVPEASVGIVIGSGKTERQLIQRIGRLVRPRPGKIARIHIIYAKGTVEEELPTIIRDVLTKDKGLGLGSLN